MPNARSASHGFTLIELMIVVAILAIITAIAIPAYNGYIREARLGTARANADSLRVFLEDYRLENNTYVGPNAGGGTYTSLSNLQTDFGWRPDGDQGQFSYRVEVSATSYNIGVTHTATGDWIRCENRMNKCCDNKTSGASGVGNACP